MSADDKRARFRDLHMNGLPLIMPNPADQGSARILESVGFSALATTSGGFAATLGRFDYGVSRDEAIAHAASIVSSVAVPVSADLENGFGHRPDDVAATVRRAIDVGLAGCSIEDFTTRRDAFQEAGADVLYAPGIAELSDIRAIVAAVDRPVNVLLVPGGPCVEELAGAGVARISVGSSFHNVVLGALARAGRQLLHERSCDWMELASEGRRAASAAFS